MFSSGHLQAKLWSLLRDLSFRIGAVSVSPALLWAVSVPMAHCCCCRVSFVWRWRNCPVAKKV